MKNAKPEGKRTNPNFRYSKEKGKRKKGGAL